MSTKAARRRPSRIRTVKFMGPQIPRTHCLLDLRKREKIDVIPDKFSILKVVFINQVQNKETDSVNRRSTINKSRTI
ncbi:hypothetical protein [Apis mellifera filamentous virus]|uniref:hypothetical protein n=1 Tax=Apis mellifera filamentous virus TaxID=1100043 RepID=UPI0006BE08CA|nr:hypothetical protein APL35_gp118 [Apis mellifera filamentous virus]AKY03187.1 hypothetical protein [Apis mellifera filamentous virus]